MEVRCKAANAYGTIVSAAIHIEGESKTRWKEEKDFQDEVLLKVLLKQKIRVKLIIFSAAAEGSNRKSDIPKLSKYKTSDS